MNTMSKEKTLFLAIALAAAMTACNRNNPPPPQTAPATPPSAGSPAAPSMPETPPPPPPSPPASEAPAPAPGSGAPSPAAPGTGGSTTLWDGGGQTQAAALRRMYGVDMVLVADDKAAAKDKVSRADRDFLKDAAVSGTYEVEAARLAVEHASSAEVKSFAQTLAGDHAAANEELKGLAGMRNVELPGELPAMKRLAMDNLRKSDHFDRDFVKKVGVDDHQDAIKRFQKAARDAKDPEIKAWAEKQLPHLRNHLAQAQALNGATGKGGR
ncbi:DUF4142 domain-containing protein [Propionivibrio sp.]|uniref:DUF4142 domain-containing protein n=1 Tax=Propionivibrio sp. TaxID=2212460 RepID=UPI0039E445EC